MEDWNRNDWQGRRKENYEFSARVLWYSALAIFIIAVVSTLLK
jgi:uncharacterized membrane protein YidH (DUF202 family)